MRPDERFLRQPKYFWANVRTISQQAHYTVTVRDPHTGQKTNQVKVPTLLEMEEALRKIGLSATHIVDTRGRSTEFGSLLSAYFVHRACALTDVVKAKLMDVESARAAYEAIRAGFSPEYRVPMNKQKGDKRAPAYLTAIVNMLVEANAQGFPCDYDPQKLTTITAEGVPLRTLARRVDGAFTSTVNPIAVWEIKEYYYTTTFGSRVADGIYETLLDGLELEELREHEDINVRHYLMVDAYDTWWNQGKPYLCRIVDMLHMGYVDEVLFGYEVVERMPALVAEWVDAARERGE
ncbi:MAG: hypothetical protein M3P70_07175 [Actinomycetota bacterium]|nr:hypothetical protein [Actinomycetota bacterium]